VCQENRRETGEAEGGGGGRKEEEGEAVHRDEHGSASAKFIIEFLLSIHLPLPNILT